jgi:hypothetical protein
MLNCTSLGVNVKHVWTKLADDLGLGTKVDSAERFREIVEARGEPMYVWTRYAKVVSFS